MAGGETSMKSIVIVHSYHHKNTEKIAHAIAETLDSPVQHLQNVNTEDLRACDLVGFGAGIDSGKHYMPMLEFAKTLPDAKDKKAFIFSTNGVGGKRKMLRDHAALRNILTSKGYRIVDEFSCVGFNTNSVLKYMGGMNKGRPNTEDLKEATDFANKLL